MKVLRVGSRESVLALVQAKHVMAMLQAAWPDVQLELKTFKTQGDIVLDTSLSKIGDKGLFVKELEDALYKNEIDLAVHSMKDMPAALPEGLCLQSVGEREDARDVLLATGHVMFQYLAPGAVVGTSSLRRIAQFKRLRADLEYLNIRGNLQTRHRKMEEGAYQGIILAAAGVHRLGWQPRIAQYFNPITESIPAVGQGILGVEFRDADDWVRDALAPLTKPEVQTAMQAERALLRRLEGGCQIPVGAYATRLKDSEDYSIHGIILDTDGNEMIRAERVFRPETAHETGTALAEELLDAGGMKILQGIRALLT